MRYGRITASKIYGAAHCNTPDGSLVRSNIGTAKIFDTAAMKRGRVLEKQIIEVAARKLHFTPDFRGLMLQSNDSVIGASLDAITSDFIVEVKAPSTNKGFNNFLPENKISDKCLAQMNVQMYVVRVSKGLFIVADPKFEQNKKITHVWVKYELKF